MTARISPVWLVLIGNVYAVSARVGWVTMAKPNSLGSPGAMSFQVAPPSSER